MSGSGAADAAPAGGAGSPDATAAGASPPEASARVRPAHVVPGPANDASGPGIPAFVTAVHARSADAARAALSPNFQGKANGRPMDGDAQVRLLESFWTGFPDGDFTMDATGGSGRYVITWTFQGTHGGMYLGVPPTGTPVAFSGFIVAVGDKSGVTSLDWKWDTKVFTRAVLGPDQVGDLEVKDTFRDPSRRWQHDGRGAGRGPGQGKRKKGKGPGRQGQQQGGQPEGQAEGAAPGQPPRPRGPPGPPGLPGQGKRRRRGKGPRPDAVPGEPHVAQGGPVDEAPSDGPTPSSAEPAPSAAPKTDAPNHASPTEPKPDADAT